MKKEDLDRAEAALDYQISIIHTALLIVINIFIIARLLLGGEGVIKWKSY